MEDMITKKVIKLNTKWMFRVLDEHLNRCDGDELARLVGDVFGGECFQDKKNPDVFNFEPNEFYSGDLDNRRLA